MRNIIKDDVATGNMSFILVVILISVLVAGAMSNILTIGVNEVLGVHNDNVDGGTASTQTEENLIFAKNIFKMLGLLTLIGGIVWGKVHSTLENTTVDATLFVGSIIVMYLFAFLSMTLVLSMGMTLDTILPAFDSLNIIDTTGSSWDTVPDGSKTVSIIYMVCQIPLFIGIIAFFLGAVRRTGGETSTEVQDFQEQGFD